MQRRVDGDRASVRVDAHVRVVVVAGDADLVGDRIEIDVDSGARDERREGIGPADLRGLPRRQIETIEPVRVADAIELTGRRPEIEGENLLARLGARDRKFRQHRRHRACAVAHEMLRHGIDAPHRHMPGQHGEPAQRRPGGDRPQRIEHGGEGGDSIERRDAADRQGGVHHLADGHVESRDIGHVGPQRDVVRDHAVRRRLQTAELIGGRIDDEHGRLVDAHLRIGRAGNRGVAGTERRLGGDDACRRINGQIDVRVAHHAQLLEPRMEVDGELGTRERVPGAGADHSRESADRIDDVEPSRLADAIQLHVLRTEVDPDQRITWRQTGDRDLREQRTGVVDVEDDQLIRRRQAVCRFAARRGGERREHQREAGHQEKGCATGVALVSAPRASDHARVSTGTKCRWPIGSGRDAALVLTTNAFLGIPNTNLRLCRMSTHGCRVAAGVAS